MSKLNQVLLDWKVGAVSKAGITEVDRPTTTTKEE